MYSKDLVPGYPDVVPDFFFTSAVHGRYYFVVSQAYNSRIHSRNKQTVMNSNVNLAICFIIVGPENKI